MRPKTLGDLLASEIAKPSLELAQDYAEMSIEALTESPIVKELPVVKTVVAFFKTGLAIRERHFIKKILAFLKELHTGAVENENAREYRKRINSDESFRGKVVEHLLVVIDRFTTVDKAQVLGHLFKSHVNGKINWEDFVALSIVVDALQPRGYKFLDELATLDIPFARQQHDTAEEAFLFAAGIGTRYGTRFKVTEFGKMLWVHGVRPFLNSFAKKYARPDAVD